MASEQEPHYSAPMHVPITVTAGANAGTFSVEVGGRTKTRHQVRVATDDLRELGLEAESARRVVEESFAFLLEREPNTSILAHFDLRDIERYFPDFRVAIAQRFRR